MPRESVKAPPQYSSKPGSASIATTRMPAHGTFRGALVKVFSSVSGPEFQLAGQKMRAVTLNRSACAVEPASTQPATSRH
jgi:hypothetical protein